MLGGVHLPDSTTGRTLVKSCYIYLLGGVHLPDSTTGRTLVSFWWIFCIIVVGTYSGNLIAFLTVSKEKLPFNSLVELTEMKGQYKWGTLGGTVWEDWFLVTIYKCIIS